MVDTFVIVGASLAGAKAAETLRAEGFDGRIVLFGAEEHVPYERPPLSKDYLQGREPRRRSCTRRSGTPSRTSTCALAHGSPRSTRPRTRSRLVDGERVGYDEAAAHHRVERRAASQAPSPCAPSTRATGSAPPCARTSGSSSSGRAGSGWRSRPRRGPRAPRSPCSSMPPRRCSPCSDRRWPRYSPVCTRTRRRPALRGHRPRCPIRRRAARRRQGPGRPRRRGHRHHAGRRPRQGRRTGDRQRCARRRAPAHLRPRRARRGRRRERLPPAPRQAPACRALGQRAQPARRRGADDARAGRRLRAAAVLLHRPVRPRHGVHRDRRRRASSCAATSMPASSSRSGCGKGGSRPR